MQAHVHTFYLQIFRPSGAKMDITTPSSLLREPWYIIRRLLSKRVRILKANIPIWILVVVIGGVLFLNQDQIYEAPIASTPRAADFASKRFQDKFDLKYTPNDKKKYSSKWIGSKTDEPFQIGCVEPEITTGKKKASAALVVLARNKELKGVIKSMTTLERHFNQWFNYPWVFLNNDEFSEKFKTEVQKYTKSKVEFGYIDKQAWDFPLTKDEKELEQSSKYFNYFEFYEYIERQGDRGIMYGKLDSYHKMCRFYSGGFYKHPLVRKYKWYWRVEPDVEFYCDLTYDPFLAMEKNNKKYGFTVMIEEIGETIPNLFRYTQSYIKEFGVQVKTSWNLMVHPYNTLNLNQLTDKQFEKEVQMVDNREDFIYLLEDRVQIEKLVEQSKEGVTDDSQLNEKLVKKLVGKSKAEGLPYVPSDIFAGEKYNFCHFWSNFEIARVDLWDNANYEKYFQYLDESGGFYKERWGDAPVHSLAVGMFLDLSEIHYFRDIGYKHSTITHCPSNSFDNQLSYSPSENYFKFPNKKRIGREDAKWLKDDYPKKNGVGCRCKCPREPEIENIGGTCIDRWMVATKDAENKKFNNPLRKYPKKLDVQALKKLIRMDYDLWVLTGKDKGNADYKSSAMTAFRTIKGLQEEEQFIFSPEEFDVKLMEETEKLVNAQRLAYEENLLLNSIMNR